MSAIIRRMTAAGVAVAALFGLAQESGAFFPIGAFNQFGQLRYVTWPFREFDTNNNGVIEAGEGLEILIEGGMRGFTPEEIVTVQEAFQVWQDVPTSYASFRMGGIIEDPILSGLEPDFLTVVALQVTDAAVTGETVLPDYPDVIVAEATYPVLGLTTTLYTIEDTFLEIAGEGYWIGAGTIIDADIIIDAASVRPGIVGIEPVADLHAVLVHEIGHLLGLGHTPLNNLRAVRTEPGSIAVAELIENEVFWLTGADGFGRFIGVTPTMFPIYFSVETDTGLRKSGTGDLAPDDISGISFLYPRGSQANFFTVRHEARTRTRTGSGLPSVPIPGAHVVAWADVDDDPNTPRVPLFSTMTGLYEYTINTQLEGWFNLHGIWKQFEVPAASGALFTPTYALSVNPLNGTGFDRQAPEGLLPEDFDSIQGQASFSTTQRDTYINAFASEVFHEVENLRDVSRKDAGTPLIWNFERNTLVSAETGRTIPAILPNRRPMFGDPNDVCPLNVVQYPSGTGTTPVTAMLGPKWLRDFRDDILLQSALGAAAVDLYYQVSPWMARYLLRHETAMRLFRHGVHGMYWTIMYRNTIAAGLAALLLVAGAVAAIRRRKARAAAALLLAAALFLSPQAGASIAYVTTPEMVAGADEIITGVITATQSRRALGGRIYTDVTLEIKDTVKGGLNKTSTVTFSVIGGRVGGLVMKTNEIPTFQTGEEVLLYMRRAAGNQLVIYGGVRGKFLIQRSATSDKAYVAGIGPETDLALDEDAKAMTDEASASEDAADSQAEDADNQEDGAVPLDEYLDYLRSIVHEQKRQER
ncbi:MAG TPA: hypothetical protein ENN65_00425 [Candidatus Hydrogenedentes bacterium]|nr:hypothetical protein [Candidatus Hydrogenedentota bacterium]